MIKISINCFVAVACLVRMGSNNSSWFPFEGLPLYILVSLA